jgi:hypothetical protein
LLVAPRRSLRDQAAAGCQRSGGLHTTAVRGPNDDGDEAGDDDCDDELR